MTNRLEAVRKWLTTSGCDNAEHGVADVNAQRWRWNQLLQAIIGTSWPNDSMREAFYKYPRHLFVGSECQYQANNEDVPIRIEQYQTISRPSVVKLMLEKAAVEPGNRVLDVGTGSGWQAALLSDLVTETGSVISIERKNTLHKLAKQRLQNLGIQNIQVIQGNALDPQHVNGQFDAIISAAGSDTTPQLWLDCLKVGGRLIHPMKKVNIKCITKTTEGENTTDTIWGYTFVPLVQD